MDGGVENNYALEILRKYHNAKMKEEKRRKVRQLCFEYTNNWVDGELGQWKSDTRASLGDKPALSFNEIRKFVNRICGAQALTKLDEKAYPRDDKSDWMMAEILTDLIKFVGDNNEIDHQFKRGYRDGVIGDSGYIKVEWSDENDPLGDIVVKRVNPNRVYVLGDAERQDLQDADGIIEELPLDQDEVIALAPNKEDEIKSLKPSGGEMPVASDLDYFKDGVEIRDVYNENDDKYIVLRCQKFRRRQVVLLKNAQTGELTEAPEDPEEQRVALELAAANGIALQQIVKRIKGVYVTYTLGHLVLREEWSSYKHGKLDIARFCPYLDDGKPTGVVQDLLDPQNEKNKRRSQLVHILNTAAKNSHFARKGAFDDIEDARKRVGRTGEIVEVNGDVATALRPIESNLTAVPAIVGMEMQSTQDMKEISGLHDAALGQVPSGVKSGRGIQQLQLPTETIIGEIFDNYIDWRRQVASLILSLVQQYYTEERRIRILGDYQNDYLPQNQMVQQAMAAGLVSFEDGAKVITINKQTLEGRLNDVSVGKYDVVIDVVAHNPTMQRAKYLDMLNAKGMGAPVKWSTILKNSDVKGKQELVRDALQAEQFLGMGGAPPQLAAMGQTPNIPVETDLMGNMQGARQ